MNKEADKLNQISNLDRKREMRVYGLRFSTNTHVARIKEDFKKALKSVPQK